MANIAIIIGSVRPGRFGDKPAKWLHELASNHSDHTFSLVDIADFNLPLLDEPVPPAAGNYQNEHTKKWAAEIAQYDGFVIVTPEYNHSVPASLKNALDYLYAEWNDKAVAFVGYGAEAGGARAIEHLRGIVAWLKMVDLSTNLTIHNYWGQLDEAGNWTPSEDQITKANELLAELGSWSDRMRTIRNA